MKNLLLTGLLLLACLTAIAQINMADSTVKVITYWDNGETQKYIFGMNKFGVVGSDTTSKQTSSSEVEISILDSAENSYTIRWQYSNFKVNGEPLPAKMLAVLHNLQVVYKTDAVGSITEVVNWEEIGEVQKKLVSVLADEEKAGEAFAVFFNQNSPMMSPKQAMETFVNKDLVHFHSFHGAEYKMGEIFEGSLKIANNTGGDPFDAKVTVQLREIYDEDNFVVMYAEQEVDAEQLLDNTFRYLVSSSEDSGVEPPERNELEGMTHKVITSSSIHGTGWIIYSESVKIVQLDDEIRIEEHSIEIL